MITDPEILSGKKCPYCGTESQYVDSALVYGKSYGMIYLCHPCNAWVGVHKGTDKALGRLANSILREWKKAAHSSFDRLWRSGNMTRPNAYKWLSEQTGLTPENCHIGMLDVAECKMVVEVCNREFKSYIL